MPTSKKKSTGRNITVSKKAVDEAFKALSNWGRWGKDDQIGTLNHVTPADIVAAGKLIKRGKAFALGIPLGQSGPQRGLFGKRWNPIHTMLATGTDALAGRQERLLYADDALNMPIQAATHWDSLGHMSLVITLEQTFGVSLGGEDVLEIDSYASAAAVLRSKDRTGS